MTTDQHACGQASGGAAVLEGRTIHHHSKLTRVHRMPEGDPRSWLRMVEDPAFRALVSRKRRFLLLSWVLVAGSYFGLSVATALSPEWFGMRLLGEVTVGLVLAGGELLLVLLVATLYVRRACRDFDRSAAVLAQRFRESMHGRID